MAVTLTHAVAALLPEVPQTKHAVFAAGAVVIGGAALAKLLQETHGNTHQPNAERHQTRSAAADNRPGENV